MDRYGKHGPVDVPNWDVALEALFKEEFRQLGRAMQLDDFRRLGQAHRIRVHDMMATMYQLERHGKWHHRGRDEAGRATDEPDLEALFQHGRLDEDTAEKFTVGWSPR